MQLHLGVFIGVDGLLRFGHTENAREVAPYNRAGRNALNSIGLKFI